MNESQFSKQVVEKLRPYINDCEVAVKKSILYSLSFDVRGTLVPTRHEMARPTKGGGTGFEQDILIYENTPDGDTEILPRVIAEVKYRRVTTHDPIIYSRKAEMIRGVYPFVRYGLLLGDLDSVPGRVLRLGQEFDFIYTFQSEDLTSGFDLLGRLFSEEVRASRTLSKALDAQGKVIRLHRQLIVDLH